MLFLNLVKVSEKTKEYQYRVLGRYETQFVSTKNKLSNLFCKELMHNIKQFCDKIDSIKKMADSLRQTSPSDPLLRDKIENIQTDHY